MKNFIIVGLIVLTALTTKGQNANTFPTSGNVGIGTTTPLEKLEVVGNVSSSGAASGFRFADRYLGYANGWQWYSYAGSARLYDHVNSVVRMTITNTGNIGIGTLTPSTKLDVTGAITSNDPIPFQLTNTGTGTYNRTSIYNNTTNGFLIDLARTSDNISAIGVDFNIKWRGSTTTPPFTISGYTGNVGIGSGSPAFKLDAVSSIKCVAAFRTSQTGNTGNISISNGSSFNYGVIGVVTGGSGGDTYGLGYSASENSSFANILNWNTNGNIGIGTSTPNAKLHIKGGYQTTGLNMPADELCFGASGSTPNGQQIIWGDGTGWKLNFGSKSASGSNASFVPKVTFVDNGNVGIGTSSPNAPLQFANSIANRKLVLYESVNNDHQFYGLGINGNLMRYQSSSTSSDHAFYAAISASTSTELMRIKGNGNVGVGTSTPNARLEITHGTSGNSGLRFTNLTSSNTPSTSNGKALSVNASGDVILVSASGTGGASEWLRNGSILYPVNTSDNLGIGTTTPITKLQVSGKTYIGAGTWALGASLSRTPGGYNLYVENGILTEKIKVAIKGTNGWADYVFDDNYKLKSLNEVEEFVKENNHLPGVPSATEIVNEGLDLGAMQAKQMEKIEELTLYMIELSKKIEMLAKENAELKSTNNKN